MNLFKLVKDNETIKMLPFDDGELFTNAERVYYIITDEPNSDGFTLEYVKYDTNNSNSETKFFDSSLVTQLNGLYYYSCRPEIIKCINLGDTSQGPTPPGNDVPADEGITLIYKDVNTISLPIAQIGWSSSEYYENGPDQSIDIDWGEGEVQNIQKGQEGIITKNWTNVDTRTIKITGYLVSYGSNELGLESVIKESNSNITDLSISGMDTLENLSNAFRSCFKLKNVNLIGFKSPSLKACHNMFAVSSGDVFQYTGSGWPLDKQGKITKIDPAFPIPALEYIDISQMNFLQVSSYSGLFSGHSSLKTVIGAEKLFFRYGNEFGNAIYQANTGNRPYAGGIFEDCHSLSDLDLSKLGFRGGTGGSNTIADGFDGDVDDLDCIFDAECEVLSNWNASFMKDPAKRPMSNSWRPFRNPDSEFQNNDDDYIELKFDTESLQASSTITISFSHHDFGWASDTSDENFNWYQDAIPQVNIDWGEGPVFNGNGWNNATHTYADISTEKTVRITGDISSFKCNQASSAKIVGMRSLESANRMFAMDNMDQRKRLKSLDLSQWDSRNIVSISGMFMYQDIYLLADPNFTPPVPWSFIPKSYTQVYQYDYIDGQDWLLSTDVSGDGQYFIIGSPESENIPSTDTTFDNFFVIGDAQDGVGVTQVFKKDSNNNWNKLGVDIPGTDQGDRSGYSVSITNTGNYIATGSPGYSSQQGMVRVYEYTNNMWIQVGQNIIGPSQNLQFGQYLVLNSDGSKLVVCDNQNLFVYSYENGIWSQLGNTIPFIGGDPVTLVNLNSTEDRVVFSDSGRLRFLELQNDTWTSLSQIDIEGVVGINDNADIFAVKTSGTTIRIYEYKDNSLTQIGSNTMSFDNTIKYVKLSSDGRRVAIKTDYTGDHGGTYIYDFAETKNEWYLAIEEIEPTFSGTVTSSLTRFSELGLSDDGNTLVTAGRAAAGPIIDRGESDASFKTQTNSTPVFIWSAMSGAIEYEVKLNGVVMGTQINLSYTASQLTNGTHTFEVRAKDSVGNYSNWSDYAIKIDTSEAGEDQPALIATTRGINGGFVFNLTPRDTTLDGPYTPTQLPHVKFDALDSFSSTKLLNCEKLFYKAKLGGVTIDLEHLDVSKVTDMTEMFRDNLAGYNYRYPHETSPPTEIKVSTWRPINLSSGMELFQCWCIPPDLKNWDTPHLKHFIWNGQSDYKSEYSDQIRANCPTSWNVGNSNYFVPHWFNWSD